MKSILFLTLILIAGSVNAQITWLKDINQARFRAIDENKFIVVDFWAEWCGPCKTMDKSLWGNEKINEVSDNFIPLKINVDYERTLANKFEISAIPRVIIIDPAENIIWDKTGFSSAGKFLEIFEIVPQHQLNRDDLMKDILANSNEHNWMAIANQYQGMGTTMENLELKNSFFEISKKYYKQSIKKGKDTELIAEAELRLILNDAYTGKFNKALKSMSKVDHADSELGNFIMAYCFLHTDQEQKMKEHKKLIKKPELLAQLN